MIMSVKGLTFKYASRSILNGVDFSLNKGECAAVLGTNGAGKSTLLRCLNRILKPQSGCVYIEQSDIATLRRTQLAQKVGYVAQQQESTRCTVFDAVLLGRKPYIKWDVSKKDLEITHQALGLLELENYSLRYLDELSGGELQKVVIARALAQEPDILLLDEPTSNLDLKNQLEVIHLIKKIVKSQSIAAVVTMHDLNLAIRFADQFVFLKNGRVFATGGLEVMTEENIESVYSVPVFIQNHHNGPIVVPL